MGTPKQEIDAYFGADTFDSVADFADRTRKARTKYDNFVKRFFGAYDDGLQIRLALLENVAADIELAFTKARAREKIDRKQVKAVIELYELACDCVEFELEQLDGIFGLNFLGAMTPIVNLFPRRELANELTAYKKALTDLSNALDQAKRQRLGARIDKAVDIFQTVVTFAFPEITAAKEITMAAGGLLADSILGPQSPDASKVGRTTLTTLKEPISKVAKLSQSMDKLAGVATKVNAVYDAVNTDELDQANAAVKAVERAIANEKATHQRMIKTIWERWRTRVLTFLVSLERAERKLKEAARDIEEYRTALDEQKTDAGYKSRMVWRVAA